MSLIDAATGSCGSSVSSAYSLIYQPEIHRLTDSSLHVFSGEALIALMEQESTCLSRLYILSLSSGRLPTAILAPALTVKLLRSEITLITAGAVLANTLADARCMLRREGDIKIQSGGAAVHANRPPHELCLHVLANSIPTLIKDSPDSHERRCPYTVHGFVPGMPLSKLLPDLSTLEHRAIELQLDELVCELSLFRSADNIFGPVSRIIYYQNKTTAHDTRHSLGFTTWRAAFRDMLESTLRDGEDVSVILPYGKIRAHYCRLAPSLDSVKIAKLMVMDICDKANVLVERFQEDASNEVKRPNSQQDQSQVSGALTRGVRVTGILDWSHAYFGDPLLSTALETRSVTSLAELNTQDEIIEGIDDIKTRLLLYRCYRAIVQIVVEYFRPRHDSSTRELSARRELTAIMGALEEVS